MQFEKSVLIINYGSQYADLIARKVRDEGIRSIIISYIDFSFEDILKSSPLAIILSGSPFGVYEKNSPRINKEIFYSQIPILGICYGSQLIASTLNGKVISNTNKQYGLTKIKILSKNSLLFSDTSYEQEVWMSHSDSISLIPSNFKVTAISHFNKNQILAFENKKQAIYAVQWHPEVHQSVYGKKIIKNFLYKISKIKPVHISKNRNTININRNIINSKIKKFKNQIGNYNYAICGVSGGLDSMISAILIKKAIGSRLICILVNNGLLGSININKLKNEFCSITESKLYIVNAVNNFLKALKDIEDPEEKRKIIGKEFINTFVNSAKKIALKKNIAFENIKFLVQGTLRSDVVESGNVYKKIVNIKSHHNVGGLPKNIKFKLIEPLKSLYKDEVRSLGYTLGLSSNILNRHPFPGPGLSIRIVGKITKTKIDILYKAEKIVNYEIKKANLYDQLWQIPVILLSNSRTVGVVGDKRTYGYPIVIRPVTSKDAMTANWFYLPNELLYIISNRITNEIDQINRVLIDITSKPPGTIEWE